MDLTDRVIAARKVIDDYREAHTQISGLPRTAVFANDHTAIQDELQAGLSKLGFETVDQFAEANKQVAMEDFNRCVRFVGECDFCKGRERGCLPKCYEKFTDPDSTTETGRTKLDTQKLKDDDKVTSMDYWRDEFAKRTPAVKGRVTEMIPGCSIETHIVETPRLTFDWR